MLTVRLFAVLKEKAGVGQVEIVPAPPTAQELLLVLAGRYPALAGLLGSGGLLISVNQEFARRETPLKDGDEVGVMPPFSGGSGIPRDRIRIQQEPFSLDREIDLIKQSSSSIGGIVSFVGTTRDISRAKRVAKLDFEHYPGMAEKKLAEIRERAIRELGAAEVTIIHRVGTLPVGSDIVLIIAAAAHRAEAFTACRFCIDELKRITPIWKKETTPEGESWVEEHP